MKDFFISYTSIDKKWAEWIAFTLEVEGYSTVIQSWDFMPGSNFVAEMQKATLECQKTIAVLSSDYLASLFAQSEWFVAYSTDPTGENRKLIPVRVRMCDPPGLLKTLIYCDLVGLNQQDAKSSLLKAALQARQKPDTVPFPISNENNDGEAHAEADQGESTRYPGLDSSIHLDKINHLTLKALELFNILKTTGDAFEAQARIREKLLQSVCERLIIYPIPEFEEFTVRYYSEFDNYEQQLFLTIRSYTERVLGEYNKQALELVQGNPLLKTHIKDLKKLETHLTIWLSKYEGVFLNNPSMGVVYVGVDEEVAFPTEVLFDLWSYLQRNKRIENLLSSEPSPMDFGEKHAYYGAVYWEDQVRSTWILNHLSEIETEEQKLIGKHTLASLTDVKLSNLSRINEEYAKNLLQVLSYTTTKKCLDLGRVWNKMEGAFSEILQYKNDIRFDQMNAKESLRWDLLEKIQNLSKDHRYFTLKYSLNRVLVSLWISDVNFEEYIQALLDLIFKLNTSNHVDAFYQGWVASRENAKDKIEASVKRK